MEIQTKAWLVISKTQNSIPATEAAFGGSQTSLDQRICVPHQTPPPTSSPPTNAGFPDTKWHLDGSKIDARQNRKLVNLLLLPVPRPK